MKKLLRKLCIYLVPFVLVLLLFAMLEPYNYFGLRDMTPPYETKPLSDMRELLLEQPDKIILGDSRMANLNTDYIKEISGDDYTMLGFGGATLGECVELFWFATEHTTLTKVVFGVGWYTSADVQNAGNVPFYEEQVLHPLRFISNYNNWIYTMTYTWNKIIGADYMDPRQLENIPFKINEMGPTFRQDLHDYGYLIYSNLTEGYEIKQETYDMLDEVIDYCDQNGIEIIFVIPPMHEVMFATVTNDPKFNIDYYREQGKQFLIERATVFDFEFRNGFTVNDNNFFDGFHLTGDGKKWLAEMIFTDTDMDPDYVRRYYKN